MKKSCTNEIPLKTKNMASAHPQCEKWEILSHQKKISWNQHLSYFSNFFSKTIGITKLCQKSGSEFPQIPHCAVSPTQNSWFCHFREVIIMIFWHVWTSTICPKRYFLGFVHCIGNGRFLTSCFHGFWHLVGVDTLFPHCTYFSS